METKGIFSREQIHEYREQKGGYFKVSEIGQSELSFKEMLLSCFTYGGVERDKHNFNKWLVPYQKELGIELFNEIYNEMNKYFSRLTISHCVYTDSDGYTYNSLIEN